MMNEKFYDDFPGCLSAIVSAQDAGSLLQKVREKLNKVNDYEATGIMKTNVSF